jgi:hypothetical protein
VLLLDRGIPHRSSSVVVIVLRYHAPGSGMLKEPVSS